MTNTLCKVNINLDALRYNYRTLCTHNKDILAVIKSDAYGHGFVNVASALQEEGGKYFAVGTVEEALQLRQANITGMIVPLLGCLSENEYALCEEYTICPVIHHHEGLHAARKYNISVAIKVDTGMGRLGFNIEEMENVLKSFQGHAAKPHFIFSHLPVAEDPNKDVFTKNQAKQLQDLVSLAKNHYPDILSSISNSAAILAIPELFGDLVRPGLALYGGNPFYQTSREAQGAIYRPVMDVSVRILSVHTLKKGQSLSYGHSFTAKRDSMVAWLGIGYADGYRRLTVSPHESEKNSVYVCIHGVRCPVIGRITMQMTAVDITDIFDHSPIYAGETAHILNGCTNGIRMEELATWWNTIPHDVICTLGKNRSLV